VFQVSVGESRFQEMHRLHQRAQFLKPGLPGHFTQRLQLAVGEQQTGAPQRGHQDFYQVRLPDKAICGVATRQQAWPPSA